MNKYKFKALHNLFPKSSFSELTEGGEIISSNPQLFKVTDAEIDAEIVKIKEEETKTQYQRDRATSYPEIREQLDLLYHDMTAGKGDKTGEWYKAVNKVKTDNPKPE